MMKCIVTHPVPVPDPDPLFGGFFFPFFSLRASFLAYLKYSQLYLLYLFLFTD